MQLNCKVIKKVATPHFYNNLPFPGLSPFSSKMFGTPPQVTQFLEGPTPPPLIRGKGFNYEHHTTGSSNVFFCQCGFLVHYVYSISTNLAFLILVNGKSGIMQTKMEVSIQFWALNLGLSPKNGNEL